MLATPYAKENIHWEYMELENKQKKTVLFIITTLAILLLNSSVIQIEDTLRDLFSSGTLPRIGNDVVYTLLILNKVKLYSILASGANMAY